MSEQLTVSEIRNDLEAEVKLAADDDDMTPWQFRYIMHTQFLLSQLDTITEERDTLLASLKEVMEYPDCLSIKHKSSELDRAIKAIEEVESERS